ncbi:hypothetical protein [Streptomyces sp. HUAS TT20]|uniref:hypothetical protein n=1 Tax=Streptomyces sp. HUAS TT20 TaxID=3447509 RepID=UPI0021DA7C0F|nr:hypothetical protein [Streptomyces sp. HUAS 15-9]UXY30823.1 hypothetical protein N8I87_32565 [Streptomyces sp. HUAS 15-9]
MRLSRAASAALALATLPAIVATTTAASPQAAPKNPAPAAVFTFDTGEQAFDAMTSTGQKVTTLATHIGQAADTKILAAGNERAVSDTTLTRVSDPQARAAWAASSRFVDLSWADIGASHYTVYRDGTQIATTSTNSFRDTQVTPGSNVDYRIIGTAKGDTHTWALSATIPASNSVQALNATAKGIEAKARKYDKSKLVWRSFIRPTWATVPGYLEDVSGCKYTKGYKYAGDAHGFSAKQKGSSFRASVTGTVDWKNGKTPWSRATGKTRVYKKSNNRLVATGQASPKKIKFKALNAHNGKDRGVRIIVEATDPFCPSGGIRRAGIGASAVVQLTRSGSFHVTGKYRQAPDHELYLYNYSGKKYKTKTIFRAKMLNLTCLSQPACQIANIAAKG